MGTPGRTFLVASAFAWLSGCAVGPDYESPSIAVPATFATAPLTPAVAGAPVTPDFVRWWDSLRDPQLSWLVKRAIEGNPDIEIALMRILEEQVATAAQAAVLRYVAFYKALGGGWEL